MEDYEALLANVLRILSKHGFPEKRVSLPLEKLYESAYAKGLNFNKALELLAARGISHEKTTEKIIFFPLEIPPDMLAQAQAMLRDMAPEQRQKLEELIKGMSDAERAEILQSFQGRPGDV